MNKILIIGGVVVVAVLAITLLSNDEGAMTPTDVVDTNEPAMNDTAEDSMATEPPAEAESDMAMEPTIVELAAETDSLSTLVTAVTSAELGDVLSAEGPYTVLAPQNSAFEALPAGTLDTLLEQENMEQLQTVLTNHVISSAALSSDLSDGMTLTTLAGEELLVSVAADGTVMIGDATVVTADVEASNGVVHIIDSVIVPTE